MPWKEVEQMDEKEKFVRLAQSGHFTITQLCEEFGISRKTGHKYLTRFTQEGVIGLKERSRRPHGCPWATDDRVENLILKERRDHQSWGPKKIRDRLMKDHGIKEAPHESTIAQILHRHGLSRKKRRRPGVYRIHPEHLTQPSRPNEVWTFDFKGWFLLGDGTRCDPLTVCDRFTRYVIGCQAFANQQFKTTLKGCKSLMRYHGLPEVIRVDNGTPFASGALGGLSLLSVWWIEQGIRVEFIDPASPQQNGSHERMHRDLKAEATRPASKNLSAQQKRFDRWKHTYNYERPHEGLDMLRPGEIYLPSQRRLGEKDKINYPADYEIKRVSPTGDLIYQGERFYMGEIFAGCRVGLVQNLNGVMELHYANLHLGNLEFDSGDVYQPGPIIVRPQKPVRQKTRKTKKGKRC